MNNEIINGYCELILINTLGQKVFQKKIIQGEDNLVYTELSIGLYQYIISNKQQISYGKVIIE